MLIGDCCIRNARQPHISKNIAVIFKDKQYNWKELNEACNSLAHALQEIGVKKGDRVALLLKNSDAVIISYYGITKIATIVPINYMSSKKEIIYILNDCEAEVLIISNNLLYHEEAIKTECPKIKNIIVYNQDGLGTPPQYKNFEDLIIKYSKEEPIPFKEILSTDMAYLMYTGGTTGLPKGVMLSHDSLLINSLSTATYVTKKIDPDNLKILIAIPLFHIAANIGAMQAVLIGSTMVIMDGFVIKDFLETVVKHKCIGFGLVPTMINLLINSSEIEEYREYLEKNILMIVYGASPMAPTVLRKTIKTFPASDFFQYFGQTEYSPVMAVLDPIDHEKALQPGNEYLLTAAGRAMVGTDIRIVNDEGVDVKLGEIGEIIAKGYGTMIGYWKNQDKTNETIKDNWLFTGDMGRMDEDGYIYCVDRKKDMIISGGENIYTKEVEDALYSHPAILECAVIGIPDERWGEAVHAVVVLKKGFKKGENITEDELIAHVKDQIARYKAPKSIQIKRSLPKSAQGKILKKDLRVKYWEGKERSIN
ncbi:MAG: long-chain-fatty-acid--CoA ligase [Candidatus Lokiarchaeota archaeon]|nr:long-chain-fatty-acid--CoA ligase [Candidatus Lokiarchaeota archaeon]